MAFGLSIALLTLIIALVCFYPLLRNATRAQSCQ